MCQQLVHCTCACSQARATCPAVASYFLAMPSTFCTSSMFCKQQDRALLDWHRLHWRQGVCSTQHKLFAGRVWKHQIITLSGVCSLRALHTFGKFSREKRGACLRKSSCDQHRQ